jgi:hypothetical protein
MNKEENKLKSYSGLINLMSNGVKEPTSKLANKPMRQLGDESTSNEPI